jgi:ubiquinone/menaquinone biosynthesis C-methylase UbiE
MENQERKLKIRETFNTVSSGYDNPALRFFKTAAEHLADSMMFSGNENVLDVACGTGNVSLACAHRLPNGQVAGVDMSEGMLEQAKSRALGQQLQNISFHCMDLESMAFEADSFDAATCGFGVFFLPDMVNALGNVARHVKPGGAVGITSFSGAMMEPQSKMFLDGIQAHGIEPPPLSWKRLDNPEKVQALFQTVGLERTEVKSVQAGYYLADFDEWWDVLWNSGYRGMLSQLSEEALSRFKSEHEKELLSLSVDKGIWLDVEVLITVGHKPSSPS